MLNYKAEQEAKKKARQKSGDNKKELYKQLFVSDIGKSVLADIAKFAQYGEDAFASAKDDRTNAYIQGRQSILIHIKKILED